MYAQQVWAKGRTSYQYKLNARLTYAINSKKYVKYGDNLLNEYLWGEGDGLFVWILIHIYATLKYILWQKYFEIPWNLTRYLLILVSIWFGLDKNLFFTQNSLRSCTSLS